MTDDVSKRFAKAMMDLAANPGVKLSRLPEEAFEAWFARMTWRKPEGIRHTMESVWRMLSSQGVAADQIEGVLDIVIEAVREDLGKWPA